MQKLAKMWKEKTDDGSSHIPSPCPSSPTDHKDFSTCCHIPDLLQCMAKFPVISIGVAFNAKLESLEKNKAKVFLNLHVRTTKKRHLRGSISKVKTEAGT